MILLGDTLLVGDGDKARDVNGLTVSAEIIAQERGEKVIVFKKRRRHNYRCKQGYRQSLTTAAYSCCRQAREAGLAHTQAKEWPEVLVDNALMLRF